jgi:protein dithiol oxidoreductase (disulfide-forming)
MMKFHKYMLFTIVLCITTFAFGAHQIAARWIEGQNYVVLDPPQRTHVPAGKVEVMEVFSYGCIYCNKFQPLIQRLQRTLPAKAQMVFLPAAFNGYEDWPMFQRAYFAAQSLSIAERAHQAIFDAVWKTGELAIVDPATNRLKRPEPSLEDAANYYARITGVKPEAFLAAAHSPGVDAKIEAANAQIVAMQVPSTPCLVVGGKYRVIMDSMGSDEDVIDIVKFLVAKVRGVRNS